MELKAARKAARYSQEAVAALMGVSRPTYAKMEKHPETVTIRDAYKLAELFGVSVDQLFFERKL